MPTHENPYAAPETPREPTGGVGRFIWPTLIVLVLLGELTICKAAPIAGTPLLIVTVAAIGRAVVLVEDRRKEGSAVGTLDRFLAFAVSFAIVGVTGLASVIAFAAVCTPIGLVAYDRGADGAMVAALGLGITAGVGVLALMIWKLWPVRPRRGRGPGREEEPRP